MRYALSSKGSLNGKRYTCVNAASFFGDESSNLGHAERLRHVEMIRSGAPAYMIMCLAVDPKAAPRMIASFNEREVFLGGELVEADGDWWLERAARRSIDTMR